MIGRQLYPLLKRAGFTGVRVSPRMVYADASKPELVDGFTRLTFTAMVGAVREQAINAGLITAAGFDRGVADLPSHGGGGWRILLHLLQGAGGELSCNSGAAEGVKGRAKPQPAYGPRVCPSPEACGLSARCQAGPRPRRQQDVVDAQPQVLLPGAA